MYLTGFADEASPLIEKQIEATKELGWKNIESRDVQVGDVKANIHNIPEREFDIVCEKLDEAGVKINCFGSTIANWGKKINEPFDSSLQEAERAIKRMKKLGTKLIRIMSFAVLPDRSPSDQMEEERFKRLRELCKMFSSEGLTPVHENCMNYGGMGWTYTLKMLENVPGLKLVYDTGNPVFTDDRTKSEPYPKQSSWEFYSHVREHIAYVHIKDGFSGKDKKDVFTYPGEGVADVKRIVKDLLANGYDGGFSIEPHMAAVFHDSSVKADEREMYQIYVEYGRRMEKIIEEAKK